MISQSEWVTYFCPSERSVICSIYRICPQIKYSHSANQSWVIFPSVWLYFLFWFVWERFYSSFLEHVQFLGERNWREDEWRGEFDQSDSILFVCQRWQNFSSSNSIIVYISHEFYIEFPAAHRHPWCNAQSRFALSRSPSSMVMKFCAGIKILHLVFDVSELVTG